MLHILLLLLKIVGMILIAVLGIVLLLVMILVFTPLRYELEGSGEGDLSSLHVWVRISFLVRLIRVSIEYQEEQFAWKVSLAWKHFSNEKTAVELETKAEKSELKDSISSDIKKHEEKKFSAVSVSQQKTLDNKSRTKTISEKIEPKERVEKSGKKATSVSSEKKKEKVDDTIKQKVNIFKKIEQWAEKLKCTSRKICDMMVALKDKTDEIRNFINDETHKSAFHKLLSESKRFLKKIKPKLIDGEIAFGFEDPSITGRVLGGVSMLYPYLQNHLTIFADFEEKKLSGKLYIKGRIRLSMILSFLLYLLFDKTVRITIRHILKLSKKFRQGGQ